MWIKKAIFISLVVSFLSTLIASASLNEIIEYRNPEYQTTQEFKELSSEGQEQWYQENSISHTGFAYILFVLTDWVQFKELLSGLWLLFLMCLLSCGLMHKFGAKNGS